jgi:hypothetical protein
MTSEPAQMSGLPLQVGDLRPGVVVVRVIRKSFAENIAGQTVELNTPGRILTSTTDAAGRAQFEGLRIGDTVHTTAVIDGETLQSQRFELPAQGGVRLVLVAGVGAGVPPGTNPAAWVPPLVSPASPGAGPAEPATTTSGSSRLFFAVPLVLTFVSLGAGFIWKARRATRPEVGEQPMADDIEGPAAVVVRQPDASGTVHARTQERWTATAADPIAALVARRSGIFDSLVQVERDGKAGRLDAAAYSSSRERLISELIALDTSIELLRS